MVSSYLVCDVCGGFGPPASFLNENGLRLCYQCWYQERCGEDASAVDFEPDATKAEEPASISADKRGFRSIPSTQRSTLQ